MSFTLEKRLIVSLTIINVYEKSIVFEKKIQYIFLLNDMVIEMVSSRAITSSYYMRGRAMV